MKLLSCITFHAIFIASNRISILFITHRHNLFCIKTSPLWNVCGEVLNDVSSIQPWNDSLFMGVSGAERVYGAEYVHSVLGAWWMAADDGCSLKCHYC